MYLECMPSHFMHNDPSFIFFYFCFKENNQWNYKGVFDAVFQRKGHNCKAWQKMLYLQQKISRIKNGAKAPLRG